MSAVIHTRFLDTEKTVNGSYIREIRIEPSRCLRIGFSRPDHRDDPQALLECELLFSNLENFRSALSASPSLEFSEGWQCHTKSALLDERAARLRKSTLNVERPELLHFVLVFNGGTIEFLARDFALSTLSETPRVRPQQG